MPDPRTYHFDLPNVAQPDSAPLAEQWYPGVKEAAFQTSTSRVFDPINGIRAVVIHATAGASSSGAVSVIMDRKASFHWLVPDENEEAHGKTVWATCFEARAAWHVRNDKSHPKIWDGHNKINHFSLGIEVVNTQVNDEFSPWQIEATAAIVRYCWAKYPNLRHVCSHAMLDPARRSDPGSHFDWERFKTLVLTPPAIVVAELVAALPAARSNGAGPMLSCCMDEVGQPAGVA
jgi:N-acetyl-anhydromuramyl-L-alanine amidase AmpD